MPLWDGLRRSLTDVNYAQGAISRVLTEWNQRYHRKFEYHNGNDFVSKDWDNLIILDGCRYDLFTEVCWLNGNLDSIDSPATESKRFLQRMFSNRDLHDTIYISANPFTKIIEEDTFYHKVNLFREDWDENSQTVTPESVAAKTKQINKKYPNKRLVSHFMQPHYPFIGSENIEFDSAGIREPEANVNNKMNIWSKLMYGEVSKQTVWKAYKENLEYVLDEVEDLISVLDGKSIITADHGNLIGERGYPIPVKGYGHPRDYFLYELTRVPWFTIEGKRRDTHSENPKSEKQNSLDSETRNQRLQNLGYIS
jgi:hypothetical protein